MVTNLEKTFHQELFEKINNLPYPYPMPAQTDLFLSYHENDIKNFMNGTWPLYPKRVKKLIKNFIKYKSQFGSNIEKDFYNVK